MKKHLFLITTLLLLTFACGTDNKPVNVTATQIAEAYSDNMEIAAKRFENKTLNVSGRVESVTDQMGIMANMLISESLRFSIIATFRESERDAVLAVPRGAPIEMLDCRIASVGKGGGNQAVVLKNCLLKP